jgi:class 3 adenylate cyclase
MRKTASCFFRVCAWRPARLHEPDPPPRYILAAEVVGYSRLMGADESSALQAFKTIRGELFDPKSLPIMVSSSRQRAMASSSSSAVSWEALRCAVQVQREMAKRNATLPPDKRINFRIGIQCGRHRS